MVGETLMDKTTPTASTADAPAQHPLSAPRDWLDPDASTAEQAASIAAVLENPRWLTVAGPADTGARATRVHGPAPANLAAISDMGDQAAEIRAFLTALNAAPARTDHGTSSWYAAAEHAAGHAAAAVQDQLEALAWRHAAQNAIVLGDYRPITHTLCPGCSTWGLRWMPALMPHSPEVPHVVVCLNRRCERPDGTRGTYTLHRLAALRTQRSTRRAAAN